MNTDVVSSCSDSDFENDDGKVHNQSKVKVEFRDLPSLCFKNFKMSLLDGLSIKEKSPRFLGLVLMAGAGFFLTIGNVIVQFIHKISSEDISSFQILFVRSVVQLLLTVCFLFYGRVNIYGSDVRNLLSLFLMGLAETAAIIFIYLALEKMPVADATVIQFTAPVFTLAFSFLCLRRGCSIFDACCGLLSFVGVVVMTRPVLLFKGHSMMKPAHSVHPGKIGLQPGDPGYLAGAGFALLAAIMLSTFFILNKMTGKKLDLALTVFYPSVCGTIFGPIFQAAFHQPIYHEGSAKVWCLLLIVGFVSFVGMMFMAESLQLEDAGPAVLIRNLDAVYAFILQFVILNISPHWMSLIGAGIVLLATSLIALNRTIFSKYDLRKCQKKVKEEEPENKFLLYRAEDSDD